VEIPFQEAKGRICRREEIYIGEGELQREGEISNIKLLFLEN